MDADKIAIAESCLRAAHDGSLSFPEIVGRLLDAGFEGYSVDYRRNSQAFYGPQDSTVDLALPPYGEGVAAAFDGTVVAALIRWAQSSPPDYSYAAFSDKVKAAGCAGYLVSFVGRRVVYYGRTAETHVELFPQ